MAIVCGYDAHLSNAGTSIPNIRTISVPNFAALLKASVDSSTKRGTIRTAGHKDWSGSYGAYGHTPAVLPGDTGLMEAAVAGASPTAYGFKGNVIYTGFTVNWDIDAADIVSHTVDYGGTGALTRGVLSTCADDSELQVIDPCVGCLAKTATPGGSFSAIPEVRRMSLSVSRAVQVGFPPDGHPWPNREVGPWDVKASVGVYAQKGAGLGWSALPEPGTALELQLFVNSTEYWLIKYMWLANISDLTINRETGDFVGGTLNFEWSSQTLVSDVVTDGTITTPAEVEIWPEA